MNRAIVCLVTIAASLWMVCAPQAEACTSILVTKGASKTGAVIITYSCDGAFVPGLSLIPAADYEPGATMTIRTRGGVETAIPQVSHTYQVVGLMNDQQLSIGETTFDGRLELVNRQGLFHYFQLMRITLQRARTAREAVEVMAALIDEWGYASSGESISIADKEEAWIFEIVGPGPGGKGAIWVAVRVPDGMISAHANMARIREFPLDDPENCIHSENVISFAVEHGYYDPESGKRFSFADAYCPSTEEQVRYSARRVWSIFRRVAPSQNFSPDYSSYVPGAEPYPLCIKPDNKLDVRDVIALHRDHYEGTEFDMTKNLSSGPYGAPDRCRPLKWEIDGKTYAWERPIATQQAAFVYVTESRANVPDEIGGIVWLGMDNPYTCFFTPLYTSITELPASYSIRSAEFSRDSAWWCFNFVATFAQLRWSHMIVDIQNMQAEIEDMAFSLQPAIESTATELLKVDPELAALYLTRYSVDTAESNIAKWWKLSEFLITKYNDGYILGDDGRRHETGYSKEWLRREILLHPERFRLKEERKGEGEL